MSAKISNEFCEDEKVGDNADLGGSYSQSLIDLHNSSFHTQPDPIIAK